MNTSLPVYRGEIQCRMLGMAIEVFTPEGKACAPGEGRSGELVCTRAFPCQPLGFWPLAGFPDIDVSAVEAAQKRHQASYFGEFKDVWCACSFSAFASDVFWPYITRGERLHSSHMTKLCLFFKLSLYSNCID